MPLKSPPHLGAKGRKSGEKTNGEQPRMSLFQTKPSSSRQLPATPFLKNICSPSCLAIWAWILKSWDFVTGHRKSEIALVSHSCYWQSWEHNLGINSLMLRSFRNIMSQIFPGQLTTIRMCQRSNIHHISKMVTWHTCIVFNKSLKPDRWQSSHILCHLLRLLMLQV